MGLDLWWRTFSTRLATGICAATIRWKDRAVTRWRCDFAPDSMLFGCSAMAELVAKAGPSKAKFGLDPRILTENNFTIKMQSAASIIDVIFVFDDSPYAGTAYRIRPAAALRRLRHRHRSSRKAATRRRAATRLRLQMRRLQPDHVGRAGAAGGHVPPPPDVDTAAATLIAIDTVQKRIFQTIPRVCSRPERV